MTPVAKQILHTFNLHANGGLCTCGGDSDAKTYAATDEHACSETDPCGVEHAGAIIDQKVRTYMQAHGEKNYAIGLETVWPTLPERLRNIYAGVSQLFPERAPALWDGARGDMQELAREREDAGVEVDQRVKRWLKDHPEAEYIDGLTVVLRDNPALAARYLR